LLRFTPYQALPRTNKFIKKDYDVWRHASQKDFVFAAWDSIKIKYMPNHLSSLLKNISSKCFECGVRKLNSPVFTKYYFTGMDI